MTTRAKQLFVANSADATGTWFDGYTCPASTRTVVKYIQATAGTGGANTIGCRLLTAGGLFAEIYRASSSGDVGTTCYVVMNAGDKLQYERSVGTGTFSVAAHGAELPAP